MFKILCLVILVHFDFGINKLVINDQDQCEYIFDIDQSVCRKDTLSDDILAKLEECHKNYTDFHKQLQDEV